MTMQWILLKFAAFDLFCVLFPSQMDGIETCLLLLSHQNETVAAASAWVLGTSMQNNEFVQSMALDHHNAVTRLLDAWTSRGLDVVPSKRDYFLTGKLVYALGSLVRFLFVFIAFMLHC
jgi:hypothetical protein